MTSIGEVSSWVKLDVDMLVVTLFPGPDVSLMSTWVGVATTNCWLRYTRERYLNS